MPFPADKTICSDRSVAISPEEAEKSGLLQDQVRISEKYGGGFPANIEGLHHLHCLVSHDLCPVPICADLKPILRIFSASLFITIMSTTTRLAKEHLQTQTTSFGTMFVSVDPMII
jgi:Mycotoxin biosynthesis protein UstYa